jgi:hypothetical protein
MSHSKLDANAVYTLLPSVYGQHTIPPLYGKLLQSFFCSQPSAFSHGPHHFHRLVSSFLGFVAPRRHVFQSDTLPGGCLLNNLLPRYW